MEETKHLMLFARAACLKESAEEMRAKANIVKWADRELEKIYLDIADQLSAHSKNALSELIDGVNKNTVLFVDESVFGGGE